MDLTLISQDDYRVNLDVFEGPLDLLLHLIKKEDLDIYDIPVAHLLDRYMEYIDTLKELDIDIAGDFLLMAAELAHIKSRMLLPEESTSEDGEEDGDPRAELIKRLLEYQQFKEAGEELMKRPLLARDQFVQMTPEIVEANSDGPIEGNLYDLADAFAKIIKRIPPERFHDVATDRISINDRILQVIEIIKAKQTVMLDELLEGEITRFVVVITFIAVLEMARLKMIRVYQSSSCGPLHIQSTIQEVKEEDISRLVAEDGGYK